MSRSPSPLGDLPPMTPFSDLDSERGSGAGSPALGFGSRCGRCRERSPSLEPRGSLSPRGGSPGASMPPERSYRETLDIEFRDDGSRPRTPIVTYDCQSRSPSRGSYGSPRDRYRSSDLLSRSPARSLEKSPVTAIRDDSFSRPGTPALGHGYDDLCRSPSIGGLGSHSPRDHSPPMSRPSARSISPSPERAPLTQRNLREADSHHPGPGRSSDRDTHSSLVGSASGETNRLYLGMRGKDDDAGYDESLGRSHRRGRPERRH